MVESQRRWFAVIRDREQLADLLDVTTRLHGAVTVDDVRTALVDAVHTMTSGSGRITDQEQGGPGDLVVPFDDGTGHRRWLRVHRSTPFDALTDPDRAFAAFRTSRPSEGGESAGL